LLGGVLFSNRDLHVTNTLYLIQYKQYGVEAFSHWGLMFSTPRVTGEPKSFVYHIHKGKKDITTARFECFRYNPESSNIQAMTKYYEVPNLTHEILYDICDEFANYYPWNPVGNNCHNYCHGIVDKLLKDGYIKENTLPKALNEKCPCLYVLRLSSLSSDSTHGSPEEKHNLIVWNQYYWIRLE